MSGDASVWQVGINGGTKLNLASDQGALSHLDIDDDYVYWIDGTKHAVRVKKGGGTIEELEPTADAIAVDSTWFY